MPARIAADAAAIATPIDPGFGPARAYVTLAGDDWREGWRAAFAREGRRLEPVGPTYRDGADARALAAALNARANL